MKKVEKKGMVSVEKKFLEMLSLRYGADLGARQVIRARRIYTNEHYNTRPLRKRLSRIYSDILTASTPEEIKALREEYLQVQKEIRGVINKKANDPKYRDYTNRIKSLMQGVQELDDAIVQKLQEYGYPVQPITDPGKVEAKIRELNPNTREAPAGEAKP